MINLKNSIFVLFIFSFLTTSCQNTTDSINVQNSQKVINKHIINKTVNWYNINSFNKVISFSKLSKPNRISIFIISTDWCAPCKALKEKLYNTNFENINIDFYYVSLSGNHSYNEVKKTKAYKMWRYFERIEEWPTIYIYSPTTNFIKKYSGTSLIKEGYKKGTYNKTIEIINRLNEYSLKYYSNDLILKTDDPLIKKQE